MSRAIVLVFSLLPAVSFAAEPTSPNLTGKTEKGMQLCPSAVAGARTKAIDTPDGVQLLVTSSEPSTRTEIRRRAQRQEEISQLADRGAMEHTGQGTGSGEFGHCPGMLEDTVVRTTDTADGARIDVHAKTSATVPKLQQTTRERLRALKP